MKVIEQLTEYLFERGLLSFEQYQFFRDKSGLQKSLYDDYYPPSNDWDDYSHWKKEEILRQEEVEFDRWLDQFIELGRPDQKPRGGSGSKKGRSIESRRGAKDALKKLESAVSSWFQRFNSPFYNLAARLDSNASQLGKADWQKTVQIISQRRDLELLGAVRDELRTCKYVLVFIYGLLGIGWRESFRSLPSVLRPLIRELLHGKDVSQRKWGRMSKELPIVEALSRLVKLLNRLRFICRDALIQHLLASPPYYNDLSECQAFGLFLTQIADIKINDSCKVFLNYVYHSNVELSDNTFLVCHPEFINRYSPAKSSRRRKSSIESLMLKAVAEMLPEKIGERLWQWKHGQGIRLRRDELQPCWHPLADNVARISKLYYRSP